MFQQIYLEFTVISITLTGMYQNQKAFTLVEVMVAVGLSSIAILILLQLSSLQTNFSQQSKLQIVKTQIQLKIERELGVPATIEKTIDKAVNVDFKNCYPKASSTTACDTAKRDVAIFDSNGIQISGTEAFPVYYNQYGEICTTPSSECVFQVFTKFRSVCPSNASTCDRTIGLGLSYVIDQIPGQTPLGGITIRKVTSPYIPIDMTIFGSCNVINNPVIILGYIDGAYTGEDPWTWTNGGLYVKVRTDLDAYSYTLKIKGLKGEPNFYYYPGYIVWAPVSGGESVVTGTPQDIHFMDMRSPTKSSRWGIWDSKFYMNWEITDSSGNSITGKSGIFISRLDANHGKPRYGQIYNGRPLGVWHGNYKSTGAK